METQKTLTDDIRKELRGEFPAEAYSQHPTKTYLTTLKAMYVTERLNNVFGIGKWTLEHEVIKEQDNQVLIKGKLVFLEYDINLTEQYGSHAITGKGVDIADGYKSAITDCISKSASYLEIGIDMFKGKIAPPKTQNKGKTVDQKKIHTWLTKDQYNQTLDSTLDGITRILKDYDGKNGKGMKAEYRKELEDIVREAVIDQESK